MTKLSKKKFDAVTPEALEILMDRKLYLRLRRTSEMLEDDLRKGRLASLEQVFGEN